MQLRTAERNGEHAEDGVKAEHMEHGEKPYFSPRVPLIRPVRVHDAQGTRSTFLS